MIIPLLKLLSNNKNITAALFAAVMFILLSTSCGKENKEVVDVSFDPEKSYTMKALDISTLISDSGITRYRLNTKKWLVFEKAAEPHWYFPDGVYVEKFDTLFRAEASIKADTAYYYDQQKIWKLYGRVSILTKDGLRFNSEQLTWDQNKHELSSNVFSKLVTPERTLQGSHFWSDEKMTRYYVSNSKGSFEKGDLTGGGGAADTLSSQPDSVKNNFRQPATPVRATTIPIMH